MTAKGGLAFAQIAGHGLAQNFFGGGEVEHVVDDLESQADGAAVGGELASWASVAPAKHRAQAHGDGEEAGGLAKDEVVVLGFGDGFAELLNLQQLAFDHLLGEADEQVEDAEVLLFKRDLERPACRASRRPGRTSRCPRWCWAKGGRGGSRRRR